MKINLAPRKCNLNYIYIYRFHSDIVYTSNYNEMIITLCTLHMSHNDHIYIHKIYIYITKTIIITYETNIFENKQDKMNKDITYNDFNNQNHEYDDDDELRKNSSYISYATSCRLHQLHNHVIKYGTMFLLYELGTLFHYIFLCI
jgi:hypothetical protein